MGDATVDAILQVYAHVRSDDTLQASEGITRLMSKFRICSILRITNNSRRKAIAMEMWLFCHFKAGDAKKHGQQFFTCCPFASLLPYLRREQHLPSSQKRCFMVT